MIRGRRKICLEIYRNEKKCKVWKNSILVISGWIYGKMLLQTYFWLYRASGLTGIESGTIHVFRVVKQNNVQNHHWNKDTTHDHWKTSVLSTNTSVEYIWSMQWFGSRLHWISSTWFNLSPAGFERTEATAELDLICDFERNAVLYLDRRPPGTKWLTLRFQRWMGTLGLTLPGCENSVT